MARILIIDDSAFIRARIRGTLEAAGHEAIEAEGGVLGLQLTEEVVPDCVLLDLAMPEFSGWQVLDALRERGSAIPILVVTADIQQTTRRKCIELGVRAVLNKPPGTSELIAAVSEAVTDKDGAEPS